MRRVPEDTPSWSTRHTARQCLALALVVVLAAVMYSYLNPAIDFVKTYTATTAAKAKLHQLQDENRKLHNAVQSADKPLVIERKARAQGMVAPGEKPTIVHGLGG